VVGVLPVDDRGIVIGWHPLCDGLQGRLGGLEGVDVKGLQGGGMAA
jgi:hypothetical protein